MTLKVEQNPKKTMARDDTRRHGKAREDTTRHEKAREGMRRHGKAREGTARHEKARARGHGHEGTGHEGTEYILLDMKEINSVNLLRKSLNNILLATTKKTKTDKSIFCQFQLQNIEST